MIFQKVSLFLLEVSVVVGGLCALCVVFWACPPCHSFPKKGEAKATNQWISAAHLDLPKTVSSSDGQTENWKSTKFLFVQHFPQHLGMASNSMKALLALSKALNRTVVSPFVQHARMSGVPASDSDSVKPLHHYFDGRHLNLSLDMAGVNRLASLQEMSQACSEGWDVVVHFRSRDLEAEVWGHSTADTVRAIENAAEQRLSLTKEAAIIDCPALADYVQSFPEKYDGFRRPPKVLDSKCVEGQRLSSVDLLENLVFKHQPCVNILLWTTTERTGLPLEAHINAPVLQDFTLRHSKTFRRQAETLRRQFLGMNYIGVHIGVYSLFRRFGHDFGIHLDRALAQLNKEAYNLNRWSNRYNNKEVYMVADLDDTSLLEDNTSLLFNLTDMVETAQKKLDSFRAKFFTRKITFPPAYSDHGSKALINAEILSSADYFLTIGGGSFQSWVVDNFIRRHPGNLFTSQVLWRFSQTA